MSAGRDNRIEWGFRLLVILLSGLWLLQPAPTAPKLQQSALTSTPDLTR